MLFHDLLFYPYIYIYPRPPPFSHIEPLGWDIPYLASNQKRAWSMCHVLLKSKYGVFQQK